VKRSDIDNPREAEPTSPVEFRWPEEFDSTLTDTPPSESATPGEHSPETVVEGSADEADTEPTWRREATSDLLARMNTYKFVKIVDLEKLDLSERQSYERKSYEIENTTTACTVLSERSSDTQGPNERPRDVTLPKEDMARFGWRVDLQDNSYRYDRPVERLTQIEKSTFIVQQISNAIKKLAGPYF